MKDLIKKWWFWIIAICICVFICMIIVSYLENKKSESVQSKIGGEASDYISGINNAQSHIDEFSYNYGTGEVEYKASKITLEMYNRIKEGMNEKEVIQILGNGEKMEGDNTYILSWGDINMSNEFSIQIVFNKDKTVLSKSQIGLK